MTKFLVPPTERRQAPVSAKVTGRTLRFRGNLGFDAARKYLEIPRDTRTGVKWIDLTDVGDVYAIGLLPIVADMLDLGVGPKRLRIDYNDRAKRWLDLYGYRALASGERLNNDATPPQSIKHFRKDGADLHKYVTRSVDEFLNRAHRCDRSGAQSLEWALGELTGNVFHHAKSATGLLVQCLIQPAAQRCILTLVDTGMGIKESLAESYGPKTDRQAIELAVQQGITSKRGNQGWGLFGSAAIVEAARGSLTLWSGTCALFINPDGSRHYAEALPYLKGTAIDWHIPTQTRLNLQRVLKIKNEPLTLLWDRYDVEAGVMRFRIADEASSFIDRPTGRRLRTRLLNLTRDAITKRCIVDFDGVRMVTSSFADVFLGQFAALLGENAYKSFVRLDNVDEVVLGIVNGAIQERLRTERHATTPMRFGR